MSMNSVNQVSNLENVEIGQFNHPKQNDAPSNDGLTLRWKNVKFDVDLPKKAGKREILRDISGLARSGELLAIMGSTGAGKTSLLNILSQRLSSTGTTRVSGEFTLNGEEFSAKTFKKHAAYIMQEDVLMETLTPREILTFSANLRLPKSMSAEAKKEAVDRTLSKLRIEKCADTKVGGIFIRGVSGGERKRVSIGMELITDPSVLFVDEPTSGLDSFTAEKVTALLKELAEQGRTVITTIHQPSSEIFSLFDKLLLLSVGKVIYFGPANKAVEYFSSIGFPCPAYSNPADYFMKLLQPGNAEDDARLEKLIEAYEKSEKPSDLEAPQQVSSDTDALAKLNNDKVGRFAMYSALTKRALTNFLRQPMATRMRLGQDIFMGLLTGFIFWNVQDTQTGLSDRQGALFFVVNNNAMSAIMTTVLSFPPEKAIYLRETANNTYSTASYYWGKTFAEFPFQFIFPVVNASIAYWLVGFQADAGKFLFYLLVSVALSLCGQSYGLLIGCLAANADTAVSSIPIVLVPLMLFAGFFINSASLPWIFQQLQYISPFYFGFNAFAINEFSGLKLICGEGTDMRISKPVLTATVVGEGISVESCTPGQPDEIKCPIVNGEAVIKSMSMNTDSMWWQVASLFLLTVAIRILGYLALRFKTKSIY